MATLHGKTIVVVGGTSGIGYAVAEGALASDAAHVIIASSSAARVAAAVEKLQARGRGKVSGDTLDATSGEAIKAFFARVGEIDHLAWTSGDPLQMGYLEADLGAAHGMFDVRFWGPAQAGKYAKIRKGGSIVLTHGSVLNKPDKNWALIAGVAGATDGLTRGLAVDLAPTRVNCVAPHYVKTELWKEVPDEAKEKLFAEAAERLLVKHIADPSEIAEAYLFLFKCNYITGQRLDLDGGYVLI